MLVNRNLPFHIRLWFVVRSGASSVLSMQQTCWGYKGEPRKFEVIPVLAGIGWVTTRYSLHNGNAQCPHI